MAAHDTTIIENVTASAIAAILPAITAMAKIAASDTNLITKNVCRSHPATTGVRERRSASIDAGAGVSRYLRINAGLIAGGKLTVSDARGAPKRVHLAQRDTATAERYELQTEHRQRVTDEASKAD